VQYLVSYPGRTGRDANAVAAAARNSEPASDGQARMTCEECENSLACICFRRLMIKGPIGGRSG
jgi:hypothetical protein